MPNLYFFPCVDPAAEIIPEKQYLPPSGELHGYTVLENGITIALRGDGTGTGDDGEDYTNIYCGKGMPDENGDFSEYELVGWALSRHTYNP